MVVTHRQQVLFGKRGTKATGFEWQLPGGWIETGESPLRAARREVLEETGLSLETPQFVGITSNVFSAQDHSITLYFEAVCVDAKALRAGEIGKCPDWQWHDWEAINQGLFLPLQLLKNSDYRPFLQGNRRACVAY